METIPFRIQILGREYVLRVRPDDETFMTEVAGYVRERMQAFRKAHPEQPDMTAAVITALALAEELHRARQEHDQWDGELDRLAKRLEQAGAPALSRVKKK